MSMKGGSFFMAKKVGTLWRNFLTQTFELPQDVLMDLPRITMIGQLHVYIENHHGLAKFQDNELQIFLTTGLLQIKGENFVLKTILPEEILLEGKITELKYVMK